MGAHARQPVFMMPLAPPPFGSLVNMLCGRKALASTSSEPGHTQKFHFFRVNAGRSSASKGAFSSMYGSVAAGAAPEFRLVDVPGVGFTSAASGAGDGDRASWRSLLERYMTVRARAQGAGRERSHKHERGT